MKKSTLITTIAMIVVVVVALSTATYAWFSSATTTSVSDSISTTADADWIIMGATRTTTPGETPKDAVTYSSSYSIQLTMLDGLYSPTAAISAKPTSASNTADFALTPFFTATQDGTGLLTTAKAKTTPSIDPIQEEPSNNPTSAANYVRVINTASENQNLVLTITVVTPGDTDADFYAANAFSTYVGWYKAGESNNAGSANTTYYYGTVASTTSGAGDDVYYVATRNTDPVAASGVDYGTFNIDVHNAQTYAGTNANPRRGYVNLGDENVDPITIGKETISSGYYYQIKISIATALPQNSAVNIAFYTWFDGWSLDNTGANSGATVYYEFGNS